MPIPSNTFIHPATIIISAPTGGGKTVFVAALLLMNRFQFPKLRSNGKANSRVPERIVYVYSQWQRAYDNLKAFFGKRIEFVHNWNSNLVNTFDSNENNILILDDQMDRLKDDPDLGRLFTEVSHHRKVTVILLLQNLYIQGKQMVTVRGNSHYNVLMKNPRNTGQVKTILAQVAPDNWPAYLAAYERATSEPFGHVVFCFRSDCENPFRMYTNIFKDDVEFLIPGTYTDDELKKLEWNEAQQ